MKNNIGLDELVTPDVFNLAARYLEFDGANFNKHVEFLGLDPKNDFRFADLAGVDFSGANLRGFDFTVQICEPQLALMSNGTKLRF